MYETDTCQIKESYFRKSLPLRKALTGSLYLSWSSFLESAVQSKACEKRGKNLQ